MTAQLMFLANVVISIAYFAITYAILMPLWREGQLRTNRLGLATAAIFFSCGTGHGLHALQSFRMLGAEHSMAGMGGAMGTPVYAIVWDLLTAGVGVYYWSLRRTYSELMRGAALFADLAQQREVETLRSQLELAAARDVFASVLDAATEQSIIATDLSGRVTAFNVGAQRLLGYSEAEMLGATADRLIASDGRDLHVADVGVEGPSTVLRQFLADRPFDTRETIYLTRDGRRLTMIQTVTPMHDGGGAVSGHIAVGTDVTDQRRAERDLVASENQFRLAFEHAPIGKALIGVDGRYLKVNPAFCEMSGYTEEQLRNRRVRDLVHPDDLPARKAFDKRLIAGRSSGEIEHRYCRADGRDIFVLISSTIVRDQDDSPLHFINQVQDITERKNQERLLERERQHLLQAQIIGRIASYDWNLTTGAITWSDSISELYGIHPNRELDNGQAYFDMVHPDDRPIAAEKLAACVDHGVPLHNRYRWMRPNTGEVSWFDSRAERITDPDGFRLAGTVTDVTELMLAEKAVGDSEERFRLAFDIAPVGMAMLDLSDDLRFLRFNASMSTFTGRTADELLLLDFNAVSHPEELAANRAMIARLRDDPTHVIQGEKRFSRADGNTVWGQMALSYVKPSGGAPAYAVCLVEDITARKRAEVALLHQSLHDPLTGLANRTLLHDRIEHALAASTRSHSPVGLLYIDLDGFKLVNDSAGHASGDELLVQVAERLRLAVRPGDTVSRIGGDEFAVVCTDADDLDTLRRFASRILDTLRRPFALTSAGTHHVSASIGVALSDQTTDGAEQMLTIADAAMYNAKRAGKDRFAVPELQQLASVARAARLLPELAEAIRDDQLVMYGQPVVHMATGNVTAVETLIRWRHPVRGILAPAEFLQVAEHSPLMLAIGQRVLRESCRMAARWSEQPGVAAPDLHVNVSGRQLESGRLIDDVLGALADSSFPAARLVLELTETHMPTIAGSMRADLDSLRERGVRIAIDDLGTGYSSLARITQLPIDFLKIDVRFTAGIGADPACDAVIRAILGLGQAMDLTIIAEGVETIEQAELLRAYGCTSAQGYLYSRPQPETDLARYLANHVPITTGPLVATGELATVAVA